MDTNRHYTEEEMRQCPHLRQRMVVDSPFKEKITMNSESEATPAKLRLPSTPVASSQCPYSNTRAKNLPQQPRISPPSEAGTQEPSDDEDEKPSGGCPMMGTNPKKRNPGYFIPDCIQSLVYVSPFASVLESPNIFAAKKNSSTGTELWEAYPIFLKHTLLYMGENYDKYRSLEVGYKFFVTDELREKGNICYRKGEFAEALSHYEKAVSIMRWLEFTPDDFVLQMKKLPKFNLDPSQFSQEMTVADIERVKKNKPQSPLETQAEETPVKNAKYYDERMNDLLLTSFSDSNVRLGEGPELKEKADKDIFDNILFQLYSNMSVCYLQMHCLQEARQAVAEMAKIKNDSSLFLIRQAQILLADKVATLSDIKTAQEGMRKAIELKRTEKIFEHNTSFLSIFSLENHETIFGEMLAFADGKMAEKKNEIREVLRKVLKRAKQVEEAEKNIIARGLVPEEGRERTLLLFSQDDDFEEKLLQKLAEKYRQAIFFFSSSQKDEDKGQVDIAQNCLAKQSELRSKFDLLWHFDFSTSDRTLQALIAEVNGEMGVSLEGQKVEKRIKRIQREQARDMIEKYPFDLRLFEHVIQEIFAADKKKQNEAKRSQELEESVGRDVAGNTAVTKESGMGFTIQIVGVALFLVILAYFGRKMLFKGAF